MKASKITFIAIIAWFAIMIIASIAANDEMLNNEPVIQDPTIQDIPGMEAIPYTDSTGTTRIIYR